MFRNLFKKPDVEIGQRWQDKSCYKDEFNPFDHKAGRYFILKIIDIKDEWALGEFSDGSRGSYKISDIQRQYVLLKPGEKE